MQANMRNIFICAGTVGFGEPKATIKEKIIGMILMVFTLSILSSLYLKFLDDFTTKRSNEIIQHRIEVIGPEVWK